MGGRHEHLLDLCEQHQLFGQSRQVVCRRLESFRLRTEHSHRMLDSGAVVRPLLPESGVGLGLRLPRGSFRSMGTHLRLGLLLAHADCPHGLHTLPAGHAHAHPDGLEPPGGHRRHLGRHHSLLDVGRHEGRNLDRSCAGFHPHRRSRGLPGRTALLHARRTDAGTPHGLGDHRPRHGPVQAEFWLDGRDRPRPLDLLGVPRVRHLHQPAELRHRPELRAALPYGQDAARGATRRPLRRMALHPHLGHLLPHWHVSVRLLSGLSLRGGTGSRGSGQSGLYLPLLYGPLPPHGSDGTPHSQRLCRWNEHRGHLGHLVLYHYPHGLLDAPAQARTRFSQ